MKHPSQVTRVQQDETGLFVWIKGSVYRPRDSEGTNFKLEQSVIARRVVKSSLCAVLTTTNTQLEFWTSARIRK